MPFAQGFDVGQGCQGVLFALNGNPRRDRRQTLGLWETELRENSPFICVRGSSVDLKKPLSSVVVEAHSVAQTILDIVAVENRNPLMVVDPQDNVIWRTAPQGLKLQLTSSIAFAPSVNATGTVTNPAGEVLPAPIYMPPQHHSAYRYFRYSQGAQNVLDAYRNMFLALESLLDHVDKKKVMDGETDWVRRALSEAVRTRGLSLAAFASHSGKDPVEHFLDVHYSAVRCAVFHAKASIGKSIVPGMLESHDFLVRQLLSVQGLVEQLLRSEFDVYIPQGGFTYEGFKGILEQLSQMMGLLISESECPTIEQLRNNDGNFLNVVFRPVRFKGQNGTKADECLFVSESNPQEHGLSKVGSLRLVTQPNNNFLLSAFADKLNGTVSSTHLDLNGVYKFVAVFRCLLRNVSSPRQGFSF